MQQQKNVVLILADQLRKDCLGAYGAPYIRTPNLDRLAAQSVRFDRAYVANPICCPNRMSIFTGCMPSNHGLWTNGLLGGHPERTISSRLREAGYQTASIGKLHFNPYSRESAGLSLESEAAWPGVPESDSYTDGYFGFDHVEFTLGHTLPRAHYYKWFLEHGGTDDMFGVDLYAPDRAPDAPCGVRRMPGELSSSEFVGERAAHYLRHVRDSSRPFFLSVGFPDPHHPFTSCPEDHRRWAGQPVKAPVGSGADLATRPAHYALHFNGGWSRQGERRCLCPGGVPEDIAQERIRHTCAMIERIDRNVGRVLDELERAGLMDDTIIIFASDHGELLGDHGLWMKGPFFYEGLVSTPLLFRAPGIAPHSSRQLISAIDIAPTLYELLGLEAPAFTDGVSQLRTLRDDSVASRSSCVIEYRNGYDRDRNVNALVTQDSKFVQYESGEMEYTDLAADPEERVNRAGMAGWENATLEAAHALLIELLRNKSKGAAQYGLA